MMKASESLPSFQRGYSVKNLNDMRQFYETFQILQAVSVELPDQSSRSQIDQTPPDQMQSSNRQTPSSEFLPHRILQTLSGESLEKKSESRRHGCLHW